MEIVYKGTTIDDLKYWKKSGNKAIQKKISELMDDIVKHPETGLGKPEQLKYEMSGMWSRRINEEHRIVYKIVGNQIHVLSLKGHY